MGWPLNLNRGFFSRALKIAECSTLCQRPVVHPTRVFSKRTSSTVLLKLLCFCVFILEVTTHVYILILISNKSVRSSSPPPPPRGFSPPPKKKKKKKKKS